jgi:hypothetical protein
VYVQYLYIYISDLVFQLSFVQPSGFPDTLYSALPLIVRVSYHLSINKILQLKSKKALDAMQEEEESSVPVIQNTVTEA